MSSRVHLLSSDSMDGDSYRSSNMPSWATGSFEQSEGIRRVLECTSTGIQIVNGELKKDHVIYEIHVCCGFKRWAVYRRYKDFCFLDQQLRKLFAEIMPALPPKRIFRSSTDPEFVDERRIQLEAYLKALVGSASVWTRNDLALFLDNDANYLMLIWYFERMRRMQDMLSSMTIMNEEEKATLNSDLVNAKRQVNKLQERLSVMEMTFLQHATGMASEALPSSVMRSLSGADNSFLAMSLSNRLQSEVTEEHKPLYEENVPSLSEFVAVQSSSPFALQSNAASATTSTTTAAAFGGFVSPSDSAASSFTSSFVQDSLLITKGAVETVLVDQVIREHVTSGDKLSSEDVVKVLSMASDSSDENIVRTRARLNSNSAEDVKNAAFSIELKQALLISEILGGEKFDISDNSLVCSPSDARSPLNRIAKSPNISEGSPLLRVSMSTVSHAESELYAISVESAVPLWLSSLLSLTDQMVTAISPTKESLTERLLVYNYLRSTVCSSISLQLFPVGSFLTNTYLPDSNLNTSAFMAKKDDDAWFVRLNEALCMSIFGDSRLSADKPTSVAISNVSFVNQDKKMIKSLINNVSVDVSMNQIGALYNESLIESVNQHIGRDNLFKKSIILIKAWGRYESPRHTNGSGGILCASKSDGRLTSWALIVMLMWVFNSKGETIHHPLQALGHFLRIFSSFDWDDKAITVHGPADANDLTAEETFDSKFIPQSILSQFSVKPASESTSARAETIEEPATATTTADVAATADVVDVLTVTVNGLAIEVAVDPQVQVARPPPSAALFKAPYVLEMESVVYERGFINIVDPIDGKTNLCNEVDETGFIAIVNAFQESYKLFQHLCDGMRGVYSRPNSAPQLNSEGVKLMKTLFLNTYSKPQMKVPTHSIAVFKSQHLELEYSLRYAEFVLGGKINHDLLLKLVVQIISKKGSMPVGEVGKNLQSISGCEALSRRLKEQFGGLKKAIESANHPKLQVGTDHPFNPTVTLVETAASSAATVSESNNSAEQDAVASFAHLDFVLSPMQAAAQSGSNGSGAKGDMASTTTKSSKSYRRPPPYIVDSKNNNYMNSNGGYSSAYNNNYNSNSYINNDANPSTAHLAGKPGLSNNAGSGSTTASRSRGPNYHPAPAAAPGASPMNRKGPQQQPLGAMPPNYPHSYGNMIVDTASVQEIYENMGHHSMPPSPGGNRSPYPPQMYPYIQQQQHPNQFAFPGKAYPNSFEGGGLPGLPSPGTSPSFLIPPMSPSMNRNMGYSMHMQVQSLPGPLQMPMAASPDGRHHPQYYATNNNNNNFNPTPTQFIMGSVYPHPNNSNSIYHNHHSNQESEDLASRAFLVDEM